MVYNLVDVQRVDTSEKGSRYVPKTQLEEEEEVGGGGGGGA
jgi:hypothetical protein